MSGALVEFRWADKHRLGMTAIGGVALALFVVAPEAFAAVTDKPSPHAHAIEQLRWGCLIGLGVGVAILGLGWLFGAHPKSVFIGDDGRISTSKTIAAVWTLVVVATLIGMVYANLLDHTEALKATDAAGVMGQYALLFGGPLGAAILAKQIVNSQVAKDPSAKTPGSPSPKDLIANDAGETDLGDLQYVLFNGVALFYVIGTFLHTPLAGLPHIPDVLLGLTSVSAVGYVGKKALTPSGTVSATLAAATTQGAAGTAVTILLTGLPTAFQTVQAWVRFGTTVGAQQVVEAPVAGGQATLTATAPTLTGAAQPVDVSVVLEDGTVLSAGTYTFT